MVNLFNGGYPMPDDYIDHIPPEDMLPFPDVEREDWERGRCYNCGYWANDLARGDYECPNCGDAWNIYDPPPEIP